jgi:hypothetical protein
MSDVSQGPGWWLASDGKWYPPHTAPQQPAPVDPAAHTGAGAPLTADQVQQWAAAPGATDPAGQQWTQAAAAPASTPPTAGPPATGPAMAQPVGEQAWGTVGFHPQYTAVQGTVPLYGAPSSTPVDVALGPSGLATVPPPGPVTSATTAPSATTVTADAPRRPRWQPWLALVGVALVIWGAGQGLLAWAQWHLVRGELSPYGTVLQGHLGLALTAGGIVVAGLAVIGAALVLDRR